MPSMTDDAGELLIIIIIIIRSFVWFGCSHAHPRGTAVMDRVFHDGSDSVQLTSFALNENTYIGTLTILLISAVRTTNVCAVRCAFVRPFKVSLCIKSSRTSGPRTVNRSLLFLAWGYSGIRMLLPESHPCIHSRTLFAVNFTDISSFT
jgi:hypothetical protein